MAFSLRTAAPFAVLLIACFAAVPTSAMSDADVKKHTMASLATVPVDKDHHGKEFYKYFLTNHPENRKYFKGAENFNANDIQNSERFEKQGEIFLLSVHVLANLYDNKIWGIWTGFLETKGALSADQKAAWEALGTRFNEESQAQLTKLGLPHA
ncbi:globin [Necator americanus]|uniref:Globin n=1 Tax=Necator americanus TaxID=51031 RepID=W2SMP9_NECAM|nr:globin [Necator americanus]ETN70915.1 globin [Necator americanus]